MMTQIIRLGARSRILETSWRYEAKTVSSNGVRVFVYGTLKPGEVNDWVYRRYSVQAEPAIAQGQLYHLPLGYPALTAGNDLVSGVLLSFDSPEVLDVLDQFEQHDPGALQQWVPPGDLTEYCYQRQLLAVADRQGAALGQAWGYTIHPIAVQKMGGIRIRQGVWRSNADYAE